LSLLIEGEDGSFLPGARPGRASVRSGLDTHTKTPGSVGSEADKDHRRLSCPREIRLASPCAGPAQTRQAQFGLGRRCVLKTKASTFLRFPEKNVTI
jgi:hypothetical protein